MKPKSNITTGSILIRRYAISICDCVIYKIVPQQHITSICHKSIRLSKFALLLLGKGIESWWIQRYLKNILIPWINTLLTLYIIIPQSNDGRYISIIELSFQRNSGIDFFALKLNWKLFTLRMKFVYLNITRCMGVP